MARRSGRRVWLGVGAGLALTVAFLVWAAVQLSRLPGSWTGGSIHILLAMGIAALGGGGLTAGLIWLAFYSARKGYDDRADFRFDDDGDGG